MSWKNDTLKLLNRNLRTHSVVFVPVGAQRIKFSLLNKFSKSLGNTENVSTPALLILKEHMFEFLEISSGEC